MLVHVAIKLYQARIGISAIPVHEYNNSRHNACILSYSRDIIYIEDRPV